MEKVAIKGSGSAGGETFNVLSGFNNMVMSSPGDANGRQDLWIGGVQQGYVFNLLGGQILGRAGFSNWNQASQGLERFSIQSDSIFFSIGRIIADGGNSIYATIQIFDETGFALESQNILLTENSVYTYVFDNGSIAINQPLSLGIKGDLAEDYNFAYVTINGWSFGLE
jgi:hypothetical protein